MATIIEIQGLTKRYGELIALNNLNLTIEEGAVVGFIGPNGAGKTTTMRILTTLLQPSSGKAWVAGHSVTDEPQKVRRAIGYMPDFFGVYEDMKVWEYLDFFAACYDIPAATRQGMIDDLLSLVDLNHKRDDYVEALSRGMKQRLCLARTLAHDPQVLILDEPTTGLDPNQLVEIRKLIKEVSKNKTVIFSTHIMQEVQALCDRVIVINKGKVVADDLLQNLVRGGAGALVIQVEFDRAVPVVDLRALPGVAHVDVVNDTLFRITSEQDKDVRHEIFKYASEKSVSLVGLKQEENSLEHIFRQLTLPAAEG